jgi:hypothetical protein
MSNNKEGKKRGSWDHDFGEDWLILGFNYRWRGAREKKTALPGKWKGGLRNGLMPKRGQEGSIALGLSGFFQSRSCASLSCQLGGGVPPTLITDQTY